MNNVLQVEAHKEIWRTRGPGGDDQLVLPDAVAAAPAAPAAALPPAPPPAAPAAASHAGLHGAALVAFPPARDVRLTCHPARLTGPLSMAQACLSRDQHGWLCLLHASSSDHACQLRTPRICLVKRNILARLQIKLIV